MNCFCTTLYWWSLLLLWTRHWRALLMWTDLCIVFGLSCIASGTWVGTSLPWMLFIGFHCTSLLLCLIFLRLLIMTPLFGLVFLIGDWNTALLPVLNLKCWSWVLSHGISPVLLGYKHLIHISITLTALHKFLAQFPLTDITTALSSHINRLVFLLTTLATSSNLYLTTGVVVAASAGDGATSKSLSHH